MISKKVEYHLVGGAVRDLFLEGKDTVAVISDFDILVIGSTYKQLLSYLISQPNVQIFVPDKIYHNAILNDEFEFDKFFDKDNANWNSFKTGVIKCQINGKYKVDYALGRKEEDSSYTNNSVVPNGVIINSDVTLLEDLSRRDFTMNAMTLKLHDPIDLFSYDIRGLYDPFGGLESIKKRTISTVGQPMHRFIADPTRVLRLIKFMLRLDFDADIRIKMALDSNCYNQGGIINSYKTKINDDRTIQELKHIFNSKHNVYKAMMLMYTLLSKDLVNVIFNDNVYLKPTVIHNK